MSNREKVIGIFMLLMIIIWGVMNLPKNNKVSLTKKTVVSKKNDFVDVDETIVKLTKITENDLKAEKEIKKVLKNMQTDEQNKSTEKDIDSIVDPFKNLKITVTNINEIPIQISGIVWDKEIPMAVIGDNIVQIGDVVEGYKVEAIYRDKVKFIKNYREYELKLNTAKNIKKNSP